MAAGFGKGFEADLLLVARTPDSQSRQAWRALVAGLLLSHKTGRAGPSLQAAASAVGECQEPTARAGETPSRTQYALSSSGSGFLWLSVGQADERSSRRPGSGKLSLGSCRLGRGWGRLTGGWRRFRVGGLVLRDSPSEEQRDQSQDGENR
jgi:hypothetical protein